MFRVGDMDGSPKVLSATSIFFNYLVDWIVLTPSDDSIVWVNRLRWWDSVRPIGSCYKVSIFPIQKTVWILIEFLVHQSILTAYYRVLKGDILN